MRLAEINPERVAKEAHELVVAQAQSLAFATGYTLHEGQPVSGVRHAVQQLAVYARDGVPPEGRPELTEEYLISLAPLYTYAAGGGSYNVPVLDLDEAGEPANELSLVVVAASARWQLARGEAIKPRDLCVLASLSRSGLHKLTEAGEVEKDGRRYSADEAQRFLSSRGVPGVWNVKKPDRHC